MRQTLSRRDMVKEGLSRRVFDETRIQAAFRNFVRRTVWIAYLKTKCVVDAVIMHTVQLKRL